MSGLLKREGMRQLLPAMLNLLSSEIAVKMNNLLLCPLRFKHCGFSDYSLKFPSIMCQSVILSHLYCHRYKSQTFSCSVT